MGMLNALLNIDAKFMLGGVVFLLGIRHAFEPDHLAVIDGMTRGIQVQRLAKYIGFLFSFGHGLVIVLLTMIISFKVKMQAIPDWFNHFGMWISIVSLFILGVWNLYTTFQINDKNFQLTGLKTTLLNKFFKLNGATNFLVPMLVGMLFSLSFDTLSQTLAFSLNAYTLAGWLFPILLGLIFMLGMMLADGLNGYLVAYILNRADQTSKVISRSLGFGIAIFSLIVCAYYLKIIFYK